jgi:hypothetical protein
MLADRATCRYAPEVQYMLNERFTRVAKTLLEPSQNVVGTTLSPVSFHKQGDGTAATEGFY